VTTIIDIDNLHYRPDSLPEEAPDILQGISFHIQEGEFLAVIGANGSGKTTLLKHLNALLVPSTGQVKIMGLATHQSENQEKIRAIVGMVFQNPADQIVASTVEEDVAFGLENLNLPTPEIKRRVADQLKAAGLENEAERPPHLLSGGQIQKLALAGVLARHPSILLFDEPTSMLDPISRKTFLKRVCDLHKMGKTVIYVTHHMEEAIYADNVIALKDGKVALEGPPEAIFKDNYKLYEVSMEIPETIKFSMAFRQLGWKLPDGILDPEALIKALPHYQGNQVPHNQSHFLHHSPEVIHIKDVHYTYLSGTPLARPALKGASLKVNHSHIHGIAGSNGSGKSTLLQHINGILRPERGQVLVNKLEVSNPETPLRKVILQVGLVFQNPETQFFEVFVGDEIAYGPKQFKLSDLRQRVKEAMALVGLDFEAYKDRRLETLSGGEKRKVALASTLILNPAILLFDEPTAGMDPQARKELMTLFASLKSQGKTLIIASHRLDELAEITDALSIMQDGKIITTGKTSDVLNDSRGLLSYGLTAPLAIRVSKALIKEGWPIAEHDNTTPERLIKALKEVSP